MGFEDDPYRDEDGEPLMDYDDVHSGRELSPDPQLDVLDDDDDVEEDWQGSGGRRERSETPVYDADSSSLKAKPRKRLIRKSETTAAEDIVVPSLVDEDEDGESFERNRKKRKEGGGTSGKKEKKHKLEKRGFSSGKGEFGKFFKRGFSSGNDRDGEVKEMWDTIAGADSEDDQEGLRTVDDDSFIDDTGVDPAGGYGSGNEPRSPGDAPQAEEGEEDEEINDLFKMGKKRKKNERSPADIALLVENVMAELEVTAEEDADLNRQGKPAVNKLKKLPLLIEVLSKKQFQQEFLDHGVLNLLKNWLEPLPDGSLPNINIRAAILNILTDFPIDLEQYDRREQLKKSGLGKVIMFLSKSDEETTSNRKLAKDLVDKWSRPIFNKTTRFEEMRNVDDERVPYQRPPVKNMQANKPAGIESRDGDLDLDEFSRERKSGQSSSRLHATRPEATPLDFVVRPQSKIDPDEIRARAKQVVQDQRRLKVFWQEAKQNDEVLIAEYQMSKKLQQLKAPKKKQLQATKLSVEGRGMLKYL